MMGYLRLGPIGSFILVSSAAVADVPDLKTPAPVIYLADNLNEADGLGWCIDTLGRGFAELLQAHSCKPQGGDVQFAIVPNTDLIQSVAYPDYCVEFAPEADMHFALKHCDANLARQQFVYHTEAKAISPASDETLCIAVGSQSRQAGPFMSRTLEMASCAQTPVELREWEILDG